jgi:hypothetical protein
MGEKINILNEKGAIFCPQQILNCWDKGTLINNFIV